MKKILTTGQKKDVIKRVLSETDVLNKIWDSVLEAMNETNKDVIEIGRRKFIASCRDGISDCIESRLSLAEANASFDVYVKKIKYKGHGRLGI